MGMTIIETRRNFKKSKDFFRFLNFFGNIHQFRRIYEIDEYFYMNIITISSQTWRVLISNYILLDLINNINGTQDLQWKTSLNRIGLLSANIRTF